MVAHRLRRRPNIVHMLYSCFVSAGIVYDTCPSIKPMVQLALSGRRHDGATGNYMLLDVGMHFHISSIDNARQGCTYW